MRTWVGFLGVVSALAACTPDEAAPPAPGTATDSVISMNRSTASGMSLSVDATGPDSLIAVYTWPKSCSGPNCADHYTVTMTESRLLVAIHTVANVSVTIPTIRVATAPRVGINDTAVRVLKVVAVRKGKTSAATTTTFRYAGPVLIVTPPPLPQPVAPAAPTSPVFSQVLLDSVADKLTSTLSWQEVDTGAVSFRVVANGLTSTTTTKSLLVTTAAPVPGASVDVQGCVYAVRAGLASAAACASFKYTRPLPPPPAATVVDSVVVSNVGMPDWDQSHTLLSLDRRIYPEYTDAEATVRTLVNGVQVAVSSQVRLYSTMQIPLPVADTANIVVCAVVSRPSGRSPEGCSRPYAFVNIHAPAPPPPPPPVAVAVDTMKPLMVLGLGRMLNDSMFEIPLWIQRPAGKHVAVALDGVPTSQDHPFSPPLSPAYPALLMADTLPTRTFPGGMGPICVWGSAGDIDNSPSCIRVPVSETNRTGNITAAELDRGIMLVFEAPAIGTTKLFTGCAVVYSGTITPTGLFNQQYDNVPGVSYCTAPVGFTRKDSTTSSTRPVLLDTLVVGLLVTPKQVVVGAMTPKCQVALDSTRAAGKSIWLDTMHTVPLPACYGPTVTAAGDTVQAATYVQLCGYAKFADHHIELIPPTDAEPKCRAELPTIASAP